MFNNIEYTRERYARLRSQGLCLNCAKNPTGGKCYCEECAAKRRDKHNARCMSNYWQRRWNGLCTICGETSAAVYCKKCKELKQAKADSLAEQREKDGHRLCTHCRRIMPANSEFKTCIKCRRFNRKYGKKRRERKRINDEIRRSIQGTAQDNTRISE